MKLSNLHRGSDSRRGNILIYTLVICGIIGVTLVAYLNLVSYQFRQVARSQVWNGLMPTIEAGIEEAVAHANSSLQRGTNGWTATTLNDSDIPSELHGSYVKLSRVMNTNERYEVFINLVSPPTIISRGYGRLPLVTNELVRAVVVTTDFSSGAFIGMVAKGGIALGPGSVMDSFSSGDPTYSTDGKYDPAKAKDQVFVGSVNGDVTGGGGSATEIYGYVGTGPGGSASVLTAGDDAWHDGGNSGIQPGHYSNDLNLSFPEVTPPFSGGASPGSGMDSYETYDYSTNSVTTATYPSPEPSGITTNVVNVVTNTLPNPVYAGTVTNFVPFTSGTWPGSSYAPITTNTTAVTGATSAPASGTYLGAVSNYKYKGTWYWDYNKISSYTYDTDTYSWQEPRYTYSTTTVTTNTVTDSYTHILGDGNYGSASVSVSGHSKILIKGHAVWYVTGDFSMGGQAQMVIAPYGSLKLYVEGANTTIGGNGIANLTENSLKLEYWGLPTNTGIKFAGNAEFIGTVYAPSATLKGSGGGSDALDFSGACIVNEVSYNGHFAFHYDELLGTKNSSLAFRIASWNEL